MVLGRRERGLLGSCNCAGCEERDGEDLKFHDGYFVLGAPCRLRETLKLCYARNSKV